MNMWYDKLRELLLVGKVLPPEFREKYQNDDDGHRHHQLLLQVMELWIGLDEQDDDSVDMSLLDTTVVPSIEDTMDKDLVNGNGNGDALGQVQNNEYDQEAVLRQLAELLILAWNGSNEMAMTSSSTSSSPLLTQNLFLESSLKPEQVSWNVLFSSFRATLWLRHVIELYKLQILPRLLALSSSSSSSSSPPLAKSLIQALYHHLQDLPRLQAQMHRYTHALQQQQRSKLPSSSSASSSSSSSSSSSLVLTADPNAVQARLQEYAVATQVANRLMKEWNDHIERLRIIVGEIYHQAPFWQQRALCRKYMGHTWVQYLLEQQPITKTTTSATTTTGPSYISHSLQHENTRAASIGLTLQVLHRILLGIDTNNNNDNMTNPTTGGKESFLQQLPPSYHHLLFSLLIPLHKPNALVLWRDQMPVLELYHEPLTQCVAVLLQKQQQMSSNNNTASSGTNGDSPPPPPPPPPPPLLLLNKVLQQLVHPEIFPPAGNTPKQVLLLHEMDLYLGLFAKKNKSKNDNKEDSRSAVVDSLLQRLRPEDENVWFPAPFLQVVSRCMGSDHSRVAERALQFFRNSFFCELVQYKLESCLVQYFLPALVKSSSASYINSGSGGGGENRGFFGEPSWNPTVRKMTYYVLKQLQAMDPDVFARACNRVFGGHGSSGSPATALTTTTTATTTTTMSSSTATASTTKSKSSILFTTRDSGSVPRDVSLKAGMGSWRPPPATTSSCSTSSQHHDMPPPSPHAVQWKKPPLTVTGVAPWAVGAGTGASFKPPTSSRSGSSSSSSTTNPPLTVTGVAPWALPSSQNNNRSNNAANNSNPPLTITGVAPWAVVPSKPQLHPPQPQKRRAHEALSSSLFQQQQTLGGDNMIVEEEDEAEETITRNEESSSSPLTPGLDLVMVYMDKLKPPSSSNSDDDDGKSSWSKAQMAETPTLLEDLKFHDLVFGHDLGSGSFGSVRYARLIDRTKTRSYWAEYAVKVISTDKIRELGYEASVQREIAVLRILSHPGIARLVSSFRFREGAYLVLEYASGGDLYTLLRKHGSLDHESTRFVMGEVVAALASIHELGLVYSDLKTENILLTETGHIKLTDFGACRPVTPKSKEIIRSIAKDLLKNLRDGDWRPQKKGHDGDSMEDGGDAADAENEEDEEDLRIEGTTSYLPPEVVLGGIPSYAADAWALGCVTYQCLSGRPPFLEADDAATRHRIVSFNNDANDHHDSSSSPNQVDALFEDKHASAVEASARDMIRALLQRHPSQRPDMQQVAELSFFTEANIDVFSLHRQPPYPLDVGTVAPAPEAQWSRRQYSSIWAPQPVAYNIALPDPDQYSDDVSRSLGRGGPGATLYSAPIPEGEEGPCFFSATAGVGAVSVGGAIGNRQHKLVLGQISEQQQQD